MLSKKPSWRMAALNKTTFIMPLSNRKRVQNWTETDKIWTEKHEQFCLENRIVPAARLLWQYLLKQSNSDNQIEPDLAEFNAEIAKHRGKGYCRLTLKNALQQLINLRVVHLVKRFTWRLVRIVTRSLVDLFPKKKLRNENEIYVSHTSNCDVSEADTQQQQQSYPIQENISTLADAGINFNEKELEVLSRPNCEIKLALIMFELRGGLPKITNPEGFIRDCLRGRWWEEPRNHETITMKFGNLTTWSELFPDEEFTRSVSLFGELLTP